VAGFGGRQGEFVTVSEVNETPSASEQPSSPASDGGFVPQQQAPSGEGAPQQQAPSEGGGYAPRGDRPSYGGGGGDRPRYGGGGGGGGDDRPRRRPGGGGGRFGRRRVCAFCVDKIVTIDYKDPGKLRRYISDRGKIEPRRKTGTCAGHQRMLTIALKRARHVALLPFTAEHIHITGVFPSRG
jgi:small subunit ribosomal protein S18